MEQQSNHVMREKAEAVVPATAKTRTDSCMAMGTVSLRGPAAAKVG